MRATVPRLISPPSDETPIQPYARVWRNFALQFGVLGAVTIAVYVADLLGLRLPRTLYLPAHVALALLPLVLWFLFSWLAERRSTEPRAGLETVLIVAALAASGAALPLIGSVFQVERWLPAADPATRIVGYTVTLGALQEVVKYLVVRSLAWENRLRVRADALAYIGAAAVGYATVFALNEALNTPSAPPAAAFAVFNWVALSFAPSFIVGYGLGEARLGTPTAFLLVLSVALAALVYGVTTTLRAALVNARLGLTVSAPSPLIGLAVDASVLAVMGLIVTLLIVNSERRERERLLRG
ncbi:MAG: hypothetical protein KC547_16470 [Anaerolineae bacterium]|nr:hypothetical protein [Anaerolineae bacterium]